MFAIYTVVEPHGCGATATLIATLCRKHSASKIIAEMSNYSTARSHSYNSSATSSCPMSFDSGLNKAKDTIRLRSVRDGGSRQFSSCTVIHTPNNTEESVEQLLMCLEQVDAILHCNSSADDDGFEFVDVLTKLTRILEVLRYRTLESGNYGWMSGYFSRISDMMVRREGNWLLLRVQSCLWLCHVVGQLRCDSTAYFSFVGLLLPKLMELSLYCEKCKVALFYVFANIQPSRYLVERLIRMRLDPLFYSKVNANLRRSRVIWINLLLFNVPGEDDQLVDLLNGELDEVLYNESEVSVIKSFFRYNGTRGGPDEQNALAAECLAKLAKTSQDIPGALYQDFVSQLQKVQMSDNVSTSNNALNQVKIGPLHSSSNQHQHRHLKRMHKKIHRAKIKLVSKALSHL